MKQTPVSFTTAERTALRRRLLAWFRDNQRELPWRATRDAYAIWISEVMLQQTQVTTVIPFYQKFLQRFPTLVALAKASEQEVLRYWEGLGYYRRARHLHQAAQQIVREHAGVFPNTVEDAYQLPGWGRYTVGAVLSQAFDQRLPIVDANVARVLCRLFAWTAELESKQTQDWLWKTATELLPSKSVGDFNQALMELGQTICTTGQPSCLLCPLRDLCRGRAAGLASSLPCRRKKQESSTTCERAIILKKQGKVLLCQRTSDAPRWANMWELPTQTMAHQRNVMKELNQQCEQLTGYQINQTKHLGEMQYGITRFKVTLTVVQGQCASGRMHRLAYQHLIWLKPHELVNYPLSVPQRRVVRKWLADQAASHE